MLYSEVNLPSLPALALYASAAYLVYCIGLVVWRLYLSPLRKFPGPKLAAATQWYETYYEMFYKGGGMFTKKIKTLHEKYGRYRSVVAHSESSWRVPDARVLSLLRSNRSHQPLGTAHR